MKKRLVSLLIAGSMVLSLIGCAKEKEVDTKPADDSASKVVEKQPEKKEPEKKEEPKEEPYEIKYYTIGTPQQDFDLVMEELSKYTEEKINATVKGKQLDWGDYGEKMQVMVNSGENFDVCFTASWALDYYTNANRGAFVALDDLLNEYGKETLEAINPNFFKGITIDGSVYAVPTNKELGWCDYWFFNKEYVDKYDIDVSKIKTTDELEEVLDLIKKNEPEILPYKTDRDFGVFFGYDELLGSGYGVKVHEDDGKIVNVYDTPEAKEAYTMARRWYEKGFFPNDVATVRSVTDYDKQGNWFVSKVSGFPYLNGLLSRQYGYDIVTNQCFEPWINNSSCSGSMMAISVTSKRPDKAMQFINLINSDPFVRNTLDSGIEGVHYEKLPGKDNYVQDLQAGTDRYNMPTFSLGNFFNLNLYEGEPEDKWVEFKKFNDSAIPSPALGFVPDTKAIKNELAAIKNVIEEYKFSIKSGYVDHEEMLPKFLEKMSAVGGDKIQAELQKQYDAWRANNK